MNFDFSLKPQKDVVKDMIFDDDSDMLDEQLSNFIKTNRRTGLTDINADCAIRILLKN